MPTSLANVQGSSQPAGGMSPLHTAGLQPSNWSVTHSPAANTVASITQAAPAAGFKNVVTGFSITLATDGTAPTPIQLTAVIRDGATGAGTIKKNFIFGVPAVAGASAGVARTCYIDMTAATVTTIEFTAAGGAHVFECVEMEGMVVPG